jgi:methyltransferase
MIAVSAGLAVLLVMLAELNVSRKHDRVLRSRHAWEPPGDVYRLMAWAYPLTFAAMTMEAVIAGPRWPGLMLPGVAILVAAKLLKLWAIASLGDRWTFRVLIVPEPLVATGPYAFIRHPNYVAVIGEIVGFALLVGSPVAGAVSLVGFGELLRRRVAVEERALGHPPCT